MYFAYTPGKISKEQHLLEMNFILFSFILAQSVLFLYLLLTTSITDYITLFMLIVFMFSIIGFIWHFVVGWIWHGVLGDKVCN